jgi:hypothetical protein
LASANSQLSNQDKADIEATELKKKMEAEEADL